MTELIFIHNARSGVTNAFIDWAHKIISPNTYKCNLCSITYNNLGKEKKWSDFLKNVNVKSSFYYVDHLKGLDFVTDSIILPCIFIKKNDEYKLIIDSNDLNKLKNIDELINRLEVFIP